MGLFSRIFGGKDNALRDAETIYAKLMVQSRQPDFFGAGRFPDNYDGRIDVLTLHIAIMLEGLNQHSEQGNLLAQALFDYMKDDFEIALREEGLSDTGVAKRIKPMINLFYTRVKEYTESLENNKTSVVANALYEKTDQSFEPEFKARIDNYATEFRRNLTGESLGDIAQGRFDLPKM